MIRTELDAFPRFAELPKELRIQIWRSWMSPRLVQLPRGSIQDRINQWNADSDRRHIQSLSPDSSVPLALLGVNKESRYEMLLFYQRRFGLDRRAGETTEDETAPDENRQMECPALTFNTQTDTLCFHRCDVKNLVEHHATDMRTLRYAAMHYPSNLDTGMITFIADMSTFLALDKLLRACEKLERVSLFLIDPYSRVAVNLRVTQQDEGRRAQFEQQFLRHWKNWHNDACRENLQPGAGLQKRLEDIVRVQFMSQLREERGVGSDQRLEFDIDW